MIIFSSFQQVFICYLLKASYFLAKKILILTADPIIHPSWTEPDPESFVLSIVSSICHYSKFKLCLWPCVCFGDTERALLNICSDFWFRARNLHKKAVQISREKRSSHYRNKCKFLTFIVFICLSQYRAIDNIKLITEIIKTGIIQNI